MALLVFVDGVNKIIAEAEFIGGIGLIMLEGLCAAVKHIQSVGCAYPYIAAGIFIDRIDVIVGNAFFGIGAVVIENGCVLFRIVYIQTDPAGHPVFSFAVFCN